MKRLVSHVRLLFNIQRVVVVVVVLLNGQKLRSCWDGQLTLTTLFLGRPIPIKRLTSTQRTFFRK